MKCAVCKTEMAPDLTFCTECGAKKDESKAEEAFFSGSPDFSPPAGSSVGVVSTGPLPGNYEVVGVVGAHVTNHDRDFDTQPGSCGCGPTKTVQDNFVSIPETYQRGSRALLSSARAKGGNSVIHACFEHRMAITQVFSTKVTKGLLMNQRSTGVENEQVIELFCSGTAVRIVG